MKRLFVVVFAFATCFLISSCSYEDTTILVYFEPGEVRVISGAFSESVVLRVEPSSGLDSRTIQYTVENKNIASVYSQVSRNVVIQGVSPGQTLLRASVSGLSNQAIMTITVLPAPL